MAARRHLDCLVHITLSRNAGTKSHDRIIVARSASLALETALMV